MTRIFRTGIGYDIHQFAPDRRLVLGGVEFEHPFGLAGHSDADVLLHAIADALLGAAALGDIGHHFPVGYPAWADADSREILRESVRLLTEQGWTPVNIDATVIVEAPMIQPKVPQIRAIIAECVGLDVGAVSVKATTNEMLGAIGRGEGIAALATAMIQRDEEGT